MPALQVVNFGEDPQQNAMGTFAKSFLGEINERHGQRRNEEIFSKIKAKYGKDHDPMDMLKDVIEAEGMDEKYKHNLVKDITDYAKLATKKELTPYQKTMLEIRESELLIKQNKEARDKEGKGLTSYQKQNLANQEVRLENDKARLELSAKTERNKFPAQVAKYSADRLKEAGIEWVVQDVSALNNAIEQLMTGDEPMSTTEAFETAYDLVQERREVINTAKIKSKPSPFYGEYNIEDKNNKDLQDAYKDAYDKLKLLYEESGVTSQKDLKSIAIKYGWSKEDANKMIEQIFKENGKKMKKPKKKQITEKELAEAALSDHLLFGE